ncbi:efflux RND transporter periplasmic adaptor subunit [Rugamonas sp. CCM 8940]|uniref:efflux RND transporter periplasmic adaptor subunit n=1 Tax=Rugamonas sp. CCM 8940 TaxID=2765359 RepID=UPI0018F3E819|nr:efflux RND transporter periplasmic adaptor subunit [Rugamonas sp. CCM 8940]MBJ7313237.1 efflux RND transporter periplasmic adaptor subunit [Rugamonas sp. CCM 8940]
MKFASSINKKQRTAIAAIVVGTVVLGSLILWGGKSAPAAGLEHDDHQAAAAAPQLLGGKITLSAAQIKAAGIELGSATPANIVASVRLQGEVRMNEERSAHIVPRVAGMVESVAVGLGQQVKRGQVLAIINSGTVAELRGDSLTAQRRLELARSTFAREQTLWEQKISAEQDFQQARQALREAEINALNSRQKLAALGVDETSGAAGGLNRYTVRAPFDATVVERRLSAGVPVKEDADVLTLSDLGTLWLDVAVPERDLATVKPGATVELALPATTTTTTTTTPAANATANAPGRAADSAAGATVAHGKVAYVSALLGEQTRTATARILLANPQGRWRPGQFATVTVNAAPVAATVTVALSALQTVENRQVVFLRTAEGFVAQPVVTGASDGKLIEIVSGLPAGSKYAAVGSFLIKSEQGKSDEAGH